LGVAVPELQQSDGVNGNSSLNFGDVELIGIHGLGYKLTTTAPVVFFVLEFKGKLNIIMTALSSLFTRAEAEAFMDLFVEITSDAYD
jgi:hypothetical protein